MQHPRTWIEINRNAFFYNIKQIKQQVGLAQIAVVVKSNAYGHGLHTVSTICEQNNEVDMLCTAFTSEAIELRQHGITKPILVLSGIDTEHQALPQHLLTLTVWDKETALQLNAIGAAQHYTFQVHVKVDTGLSRFGVLPHELVPFMQWLTGLPFIQVTGLYSHFIQSQVDTPLAPQQLNQLNSLIHELPHLNQLTMHIANSAGAWRFHPHHTFNMVRIGIAAYGSWSSAFVQENAHKTLIPILAWKTHVMQTKSIPKGATVSYDATFTAPHAMRLGFLPVGYADGYDFRLANAAHVYIHDDLAPVVGKVAMNITTIDLTHLPGAQIGDEVTLMGSQKAITPAALAHAAGFANIREITTKINPSITRIIVNKPLSLSKTSSQSIALEQENLLL